MSVLHVDQTDRYVQHVNIVSHFITKSYWNFKHDLRKGINFEDDLY